MITVAFTRPLDRIGESLKLAESMGLKAMAAPSLEIKDGDPEEFRRTAEMIGEGRVSFVVFGSGTGVDRCAGFYGEGFKHMFEKVTTVAIGPNTRKVLDGYGIRTDIMPDDYSSYGIVDILGDSVRGKGVLLVRSDMGSRVLMEGLTKNGAEVTEFAAYKLDKVGMTDSLLHIMEGIGDGTVDAVAFTSPMSAESFFGLMEEKYGKDAADSMMGKVCVAAIGRPTAMRLENLGRTPDVVPQKTTFADTLEAIKERFEKE